MFGVRNGKYNAGFQDSVAVDGLSLGACTFPLLVSTYILYVFAHFEACLMLFKVYHDAQETLQSELACESGSTENAPCIVISVKFKVRLARHVYFPGNNRPSAINNTSKYNKMYRVRYMRVEPTFYRLKHTSFWNTHNLFLTGYKPEKVTVCRSVVYLCSH